MGKLIVCEVKIAVYGDYDGNAPDTDDLVKVDTQEEANEIIADLEKVRDEDDNEARARLEKKDVFRPYVEGCQSSLTFETREVYVPAKGKFEIKEGEED